MANFFFLECTTLPLLLPKDLWSDSGQLCSEWFDLCSWSSGTARELLAVFDVPCAAAHPANGESRQPGILALPMVCLKTFATQEVFENLFGTAMLGVTKLPHSRQI